jgi:hypothetical protein
MTRHVFFSFHYERDIWRVNTVRNCWVVRGSQEAIFWDHSLWEQTKLRGDKALQNLIDEGLRGASVTAVLIGSDTASRRWVQYEIEQSHLLKKGMFGVYINGIKDAQGQVDPQGANPFEQLTAPIQGVPTSYARLYRIYDWVRDGGYQHFATWVEQAARDARR